MASKKFSDFVEKTNENEVDFIVGYSGDENVRIDPSVLSGTTDYNDLTNKPTIPTDNSQLSNGAGYVTTDTNTQRTDQEIRDVIASEGYLTSETDSQTLSISGSDLSISNGNTVTIPDTNTQLSDADIAAMGYIKTDTNTQRTDAEIQSIIDTNTAGFLTSETDSQTLSISGQELTISNGNTVTIPDTNTQLTDSDIAAMGYIKTDTNTQLSDSDIAAFGYIKTDTNTQLSDADIAAMGYIKTDTDTQRTDQEIRDVIATEGYITSETPQTLSISGQDLTLSDGGGTVTIPSGGGGSDIKTIYRGAMYANQFSTTSYIYVPFTGSSESTTSNQDHAIVAPFDGYVSYIQIKNVATNLPSATYIEIDIAKDTGTGNNPTFTSLYSTGNISVTTAMRMEADDTLTSTDATFSAGDILYFRFKTDGNWNRATFNAVVVYQP